MKIWSLQFIYRRDSKCIQPYIQIIISMKAPSILILTPIYPAKDVHKSTTPVVHYFVKEWYNSGCDVRVIHYPVNFPKFIYCLAKLLKPIIENKMGSEIRTWKVKATEYELDGVKVKRIPLQKTRPHSRYSQKEISIAIKESISYCEAENFVPDIIVSHWVNPQYEIMHHLKRHFNIPTCFVAHDAGRDLLKLYSKEKDLFIQETDIFGYRSAPIKRNFEKNFHNNGKKNFQCYSGIPEFYMLNVSRKINKATRFIFVGTLLKRKYPAMIIPAVTKVFGADSFTITYIGEGEETKAVEKLAREFHVENSVHSLGFMMRDEVIKQLDVHDVFVMISRDEAYGLVYLEAMARGCITVASRNEGFDGIIEDGVNGFLCEAGNVEELTMIVSKIRKMSPVELQRISGNAMQTAKQLTDKQAAMTYLDNLKQII